MYMDKISIKTNNLYDINAAKQKSRDTNLTVYHLEQYHFLTINFAAAILVGSLSDLAVSVTVALCAAPDSCAT